MVMNTSAINYLKQFAYMPIGTSIGHRAYKTGKISVPKHRSPAEGTAFLPFKMIL